MLSSRVVCIKVHSYVHYLLFTFTTCSLPNTRLSPVLQFGPFTSPTYEHMAQHLSDVDLGGFSVELNGETLIKFPPLEVQPYLCHIKERLISFVIARLSTVPCTTLIFVGCFLFTTSILREKSI